MDKQTIYKSEVGYYTIHKELLLKKGYKMTIDTIEFSVFELYNPTTARARQGIDQQLQVVKEKQDGRKVSLPYGE